MNRERVVSKVWNFCRVLRDDGVSCVDYIEQLTVLLFLKIIDEYSKPPHKRKIGIPRQFNWKSLTTRHGISLENHYARLLKRLGSLPGMIGQIFAKTQNKIQDPIKLEKLISMVDQEMWSTAGSDMNGEIYESFIEKMAEDTKKGAGQYFTPRPLIRAIVECVGPKRKKTIIDPACGTGGFLLGAYDFIVQHHKLSKTDKKFLKCKTLRGNEIVASTRRLCLMNLFLQGIGEINQKDVIISSKDALLESSKEKFDYVFANPPFGRRSSIKITHKKGALKKDLTYNRPEFWATTANKQLSFLQHIKTLLKPMGQAAVIVPDNVLFEGGAGETIRKKLLETTNLHTILRLPAGIFYAQSIKTNVLFFDNKPPSKTPWTKSVWFYDYRTNIHHTLRQNPFKFECLAEFMKGYRAKNRAECKEAWSEKNPTGRWRKFSYQELIMRDKCNLEVVWIKDDPLMDIENLPTPQAMVGEVVDGLTIARDKFSEIWKALEQINKTF